MLQNLKFDIEARDQTQRAFRSVRQSLGRTERGFDRMEAQASQAGRALAVGLGGLVSVAAVDRLGRAMRDAIDDLDDVAKSADKIGITTDALQELRFAADLSGVSADKLGVALNRFARVASDANEGLSTAERAFERLGIQVSDADGKLKSIDGLLVEVAGAFSEMEDATQRAATAQELFGRSGTEMVNLLVQGADGLERMREEARALGVVVSEDLVRDAVVMKDELTKVFSALEARWNSFLLTFLRGADRIFDFIPEDTETALASRIEELQDIQDTLSRRAQGFGFENFLAGPTSNLEARQEELLAEIRLLEERRQLQEKIRTAASEIEAGGAGGGGGGGSGARAAAVREEADEIERLTSKLEEVQAARLADRDAIRDQAEAAREAEAAQRALADSITAIGDELVRAIDQGGSFIDILAAIAQQILRMPALEDAIFGGGSSRGGGGLINRLGGALGGLLGGGGGVTTAANNPFQGASASLFTAGGGVALPRFAHGGEFTVGGPSGIDRTLVQFMASRGERVAVTPAGEGAAGGVRFGNITMNFPGVRDRETAREAAGSARRRLAEMSRKGGGYL